MQSNQIDPFINQNTALADDGEVNSSDDTLLAKLYPEQRRAILTTEGPLLGLAGTG